jgi:hypothetical protein
LLKVLSNNRKAARNRTENNTDLRLMAWANSQMVTSRSKKAKTGCRNIFQIFFSGWELRVVKIMNP